MSVPLERFVKQLEDSGIVAPETIKDMLPPKGDSKDADELADNLVHTKKLTKFQVDQIARGNAKSLVLGNYTLLDKIGSGGMGQVFKAEHRRMRRIVAMKILQRQRMKDPNLAARFEREVTVAARLNHPNIVTAFDADHVGGMHVLVMEYVDGGDLWQTVKKNGPLPVDKAVACILQAARGLEAAHAAGILHRDIKPSNLMLDTKGTVKILDLGMASLGADVEASASGEALTEDGALLGTPDFMSPEQALDSRTADARSDIYGLGCTLYFLLTGRLVYPAETRVQTVLAHREQPIPPLRPVVPEVTEPLEAVFRKMVAKRPEDRQESMKAVIADLQRLLKRGVPAVRPPEAPAAPPSEGMRRFFREIATAPPQPLSKAGKSQAVHRRRRARIAGVVGGGAVLLGAVCLGLWGGRGKNGTTTPAPDAPGAGTAARSSEQAAKGTTARHSPPTAKKVPRQVTAPSVAPARPLEVTGEWTRQVASLPAHEQVAAVGVKLRELNPGFNAPLKPQFENGVVTILEFEADGLDDLSPVRALAGLKGLFCYRTPGEKGALSDLAPLRDLPLENLYCGLTEIADLSPLQGMRLTFLNLGVTNVSDLAPLAGMPLTSLDLGATGVSSLEALRGMPLAYLNCSQTHVTDLSPLRGMPLKHLRCDFVAQRDADVVRSLESLEKINEKPIKQFWADLEDDPQESRP